MLLAALLLLGGLSCAHQGDKIVNFCLGGCCEDFIETLLHVHPHEAVRKLVV